MCVGIHFSLISPQCKKKKKARRDLTRLQCHVFAFKTSYFLSDYSTQRALSKALVHLVGLLHCNERNSLDTFCAEDPFLSSANSSLPPEQTQNNDRHYDFKQDKLEPGSKNHHNICLFFKRAIDNHASSAGQPIAVQHRLHR